MNNADVIQRRVDLIMEQLRRDHAADGLPLFVAVVCNRCGQIASGDTVEELVPQVQFWKLDPARSNGQDLCPHCR